MDFLAKKCESGFGFGSCEEQKLSSSLQNTGSADSRYSRIEKDRKIKFKFCCMLRIIRNSFFHWATFKRVGNHKEGTQIFDLFFYYIDLFFRSLGKAHPHWLLVTTSYRVPCSICIWNMSSWKNDIPPPTHCQWNSASRSKKKKLGQPIWMQISVKPVVAF